MQASTCFKEECNLNRATLKAGSLQILNPQIKYLANYLSSVKVHDLMALAFPIFTVATFSVVSLESDVNGTTSVFDSTSFHFNLGGVDTSHWMGFAPWCISGHTTPFGGYPHLFTLFHIE